MEIWKDIKEYEGLYRVSNLGNVKSLKFNKERILTPVLDGTGYCGVFLCKNKEIKRYRIHRLVAQAFIPNPNNLPQVNHINEIKTDNRIENLEWCTAQYNTLCSLGKPILQFTKEGELVKKWSSIMDVEKELGFCRQNISKCCQGKLKTSYGYKWGYAEDYERIPFKVFDLEIYRKKVA